MYAHTHTYIQTDEQTDRQTDRQPNTHIHTQTHTHKHTHMYIYAIVCLLQEWVIQDEKLRKQKQEKLAKADSGLIS